MSVLGWIAAVSAAWIAAGLLVARWVGSASGPRDPRDDEAREFSPEFLEAMDDSAPLVAVKRDGEEVADLVEDALEDFYGEPLPGVGGKVDRPARAGLVRPRRGKVPRADR